MVQRAGLSLTLDESGEILPTCLFRKSPDSFQGSGRAAGFMGSSGYRLEDLDSPTKKWKPTIGFPAVFAERIGGDAVKVAIDVRGPRPVEGVAALSGGVGGVIGPPDRPHRPLATAMGSPEALKAGMRADRAEHSSEILRDEITEQVRQQALSKQTPSPKNRG